MKKIFSFLVALAMSISLSSCVATVSAQDDMYNGEVDATVVISYGTPVLNAEGFIMYYTYRGWYYYPYYINGDYYFHRYRRVLPPNDFNRWYRPIPRERFHPRPHHSAPYHKPHAAPPRPHHHHGGNMHRPHTPNNHHGGNMHRPSRPTNHGGGHFGGRR